MSPPSKSTPPKAKSPPDTTNGDPPLSNIRHRLLGSAAAASKPKKRTGDEVGSPPRKRSRNKRRAFANPTILKGSIADLVMVRIGREDDRILLDELPPVNPPPTVQTDEEPEKQDTTNSMIILKKPPPLRVHHDHPFQYEVNHTVRRITTGPYKGLTGMFG
jgi:hypothetical protein